MKSQLLKAMLNFDINGAAPEKGSLEAILDVFSSNTANGSSCFELYKYSPW